VLEVFAHLADQRCTADLPVPRHDRRRTEPLQLLEQGDPPAPVRVLVRQDREEAVLDEVACEEDPFFRQQHELIAACVRRPVVAEPHGDAAEVELRLIAAVDNVRAHELDIG
jgi:hypothetical protein